MSKNVFNIADELVSNTYPGRGIIFGRTKDNKRNVAAYFIMGQMCIRDRPGIRACFRASVQLIERVYRTRVYPCPHLFLRRNMR